MQISREKEVSSHSIIDVQHRSPTYFNYLKQTENHPLLGVIGLSSFCIRDQQMQNDERARIAIIYMNVEI